MTHVGAVEAQESGSDRNGRARVTNRDRILETSLTLFNERGVPAVSTKTIAAHLGISSGNLYYHFANKEEIVRELWNQAAAATAPVAPPDDGSLLPPEEFAEMLVTILRNLSTFRFIVRDMDELMRRDPVLAESLRDSITLGQGRSVDVLDSLIGHGVMTAPRDHRDLERLSIGFLTLLMNWLRFLGNGRSPTSETDQQLADGALHAFVLLEPRLEQQYAQQARESLERRIHPSVTAASKPHRTSRAGSSPRTKRARTTRSKAADLPKDS